jgi:SH3 domain protein
METRVKKSIIASAIPKQNDYDISGKIFSEQVFSLPAAIVLKLKKFITRSALLTLVYLCASNPLYALETRYVTDEFEVTMRSGTSTSNSIVRMLRSGEALTVLEEDLPSQYSLVEAEGGKQGYVLSRFLMEKPAAKQTLLELEERFAQQQQRLAEQATEVAELKQKLDREKTDNGRTAAQDTLNILAQNEQLQTTVEQLRQEKTQLSEANSELSDSTRLDWFVRGGAVSLIAFVIGIVVTRIRWKKQDSWGSY